MGISYCELILHQTADGKFAVVSDYSINFIDSLKRRVPSDVREWNPDAQRWLIADSYRVSVAELAKSCFKDVCQREEFEGVTVTTDLRTGAQTHQPSLF
ncbi:MAG: hypothetical protein MSG64_19730 [Pyrinomonadaceae bacterium MAG19_C2-C3]|nr:hypothetical protein [Pyrinomonadaceae bacterium MAG19_C2-C3]